MTKLFNAEEADKLKAERIAKGEKSLEFVDYIDICAPFGIPDTSINKGLTRLSYFVENNPVIINLEKPHSDIDNIFTINKQEDVLNHKLQLRILKKRVKPSSLLFTMIEKL